MQGGRDGKEVVGAETNDVLNSVDCAELLKLKGTRYCYYFGAAKRLWMRMMEQV